MLEITQKEKDLIAKAILDALGVAYYTSDIVGATYALDNHKVSGYNVLDFKDILQDELLAQFYKDLILSWFLQADPVDNRSWGFDLSDEPLPYRLVGAFGNDKLPLYKFGALSAVPDNVVLLCNDTIYLSELRKLYMLFSDNYDTLSKLYVGWTSEFGVAFYSIRSQIDYKLKYMSMLI